MQLKVLDRQRQNSLWLSYKMLNLFKQKNRNARRYSNLIANDFFSPRSEEYQDVDIVTFYNNPIVRQCVDFIISSIQRVPWVLYKNNKKITEVHTFFNPKKVSEDSLVTFKNKMVRDYILYGTVQVAVVRQNRKALFEQAKLIDPIHEILVPQYDDRTGDVLYYEQEDTHIPSFQAFKESSRGQGQFIAEWKNLTLDDRFNAKGGYIDVLSCYIDTMRALNQRANSLAKGAYNTKHIITTKDTTIEEEKAFVDKLQSSKRKDNVFVVNGVDLDVHTIDNTISNIFDKVSTDDIKRTIAGVFGVPVALISPSSVDGSKYSSNFKESRLAFYEDTIIPRYLVPMQEFLTSIFFPDEYKLLFDLDSIDCLREKRINFYAMLDKVSFLSDEEKRQLANIK